MVFIMNVISFTELRKNLKGIMDTCADQFEPVIINRPKGENMVLITQRDYESLKETAYLLGSEANAEHLRKSIESLQSGKAKQRKLLEE